MLDAAQKHFLRLVDRDANSEGWTKIAGQWMGYATKLPSDLITVKSDGEGGVGKLTPEGKVVLKYC